MLFGIMPPGKGQFHAVKGGGDPDVGQPYEGVSWALPGKKHGALKRRFAATTQQTWGAEFFYLHIGPGLTETSGCLSTLSAKVY